MNKSMVFAIRSVPMGFKRTKMILDTVSKLVRKVIRIVKKITAVSNLNSFKSLPRPKIWINKNAIILYQLKLALFALIIARHGQ